MKPTPRVEMTAAESDGADRAGAGAGGMRDGEHEGVPVWTRGPRLTLVSPTSGFELAEGGCPPLRGTDADETRPRDPAPARALLGRLRGAGAMTR